MYIKGLRCYKDVTNVTKSAEVVGNEGDILREGILNDHRVPAGVGVGECGGGRQAGVQEKGFLPLVLCQHRISPWACDRVPAHLRPDATGMRPGSGIRPVLAAPAETPGTGSGRAGVLACWHDRMIE